MKVVVNTKTITLYAKEILKDIVLHKSLHGATVIYLLGDIGAGKTTLMQSFGKELGISKKIISPTFPILKVYPLRRKPFTELFHIDAYRLSGKVESVTDYIKEKSKEKNLLICVEWPNNLPKGTLSPHGTIRLSFVKKDTTLRQLSYANKVKQYKKTKGRE